MLETRKFEAIFSEMENLFELIKEELLLDEWVRDKTRIVFAQTTHLNEEQSFEAQAIYLYWKKSDRDENYLLGETKYAGDDSTRNIRQWVKENCKADKCWIEKACSLKLEGHQVDIWCICYSVCLDENSGKRLLELTFRKWLRSLENSGWYSLIEMSNSVSSKEPFSVEKPEGKHKFIQEVLHEASCDLRKWIEHFYNPIEISDIVSLSGEYYEKAGCQSNLLFLPQGNNSDPDGYELVYDLRELKKEKRVLEWRNIRLLRKLSQITQEELWLLFTADQAAIGENYEVMGIYRRTAVNREETDEGKTDLDAALKNADAWNPLLPADKKRKLSHLNIKIRKHMQFDLFIDNAYILTCLNGYDKIRLGLSKEIFLEICREVFGENRDFASVIQSLSNSQKQSHGTMIVILDERDAKSEVKRLSEKGFGIRDCVPRSVSDFINHLNAIDGSVIMDTDGRIYGIGMMLDGSSKTEGDIAKGTRHNSARRYHDYMKESKIRGIILVVSEDGMTKILTNKPSDSESI